MYNGMFSYVTVVYGLKQNQRLHELPGITELLACRNNIIYEHYPLDNESCGWPGLHYHGLFEFITQLGFHNDRILNQIKTHCNHFTINDCNNPLEYFTLVDQCGMKLVCTNTCPPSHLFEHRKLSDALKHVNSTPTTTTITVNENVPRVSYFQMSKNAKCHTSILDLCQAFSSGSSSLNGYLTPIDSAIFVDKWCVAQNISTEIFISKWIDCFDCKTKFKNTLYFQGDNNSCIKAILQSVMEACGESLVGKVWKGTTGYKYFWKCCLGKRMIALYEPYFDGLYSSDKMLEILEGSDSRIKIDNNSHVTMHRTPVVVITRDGQSSRKLQFEIKNRSVNCYSELKSFRPPEAKLHPAWLCLLAEKYIVQRNDSESHASPNEEANIKDDTEPRRQDTENTKSCASPNEADRQDAEDTQPIRQNSNLDLQEEECENTSDSNCSEISEDDSDYGPKLVMDIPQISSTPPDCEKFNEEVPQPNEVNNEQDLNEEADIQDNTDTEPRRQNIEDTEPCRQNSNLGLQKEKCENTSDLSCSEISEDNSYYGPKLVMDIPQISSTPPDCEKFNDDVPQPYEVNHEQDVGECGHEVRGTEENISAIGGLFQPDFADLASQEINSHGHTNIRVNKKKEIKKSELIFSTPASFILDQMEQNTPITGLFRPAFAELPSSEMNSHGPSNIKVNEEKHSKGVQRGKKRSADETLTAKEKIQKNWNDSDKKHPYKEWNVTFKNLLNKNI